MHSYLVSTKMEFFGKGLGSIFNQKCYIANNFLPFLEHLKKNINFDGGLGLLIAATLTNSEAEINL